MHNDHKSLIRSNLETGVKSAKVYYVSRRLKTSAWSDLL